MLREVQLNIGVEKVDIHESIIVKALLNSGATEMFMDKKNSSQTWVQTAETRKTSNNKKCGWYKQQWRSNYTLGGSQCIL